MDAAKAVRSSVAPQMAVVGAPFSSFIAPSDASQVARDEYIIEIGL